MACGNARRVSDGMLHDLNVLDLLALEAGAVFVMDPAYVDSATRAPPPDWRVLHHPLQEKNLILSGHPA